MMTFNQFLSMTSAVPEPLLRHSMAEALLVEPARTPDARGRFYERVVRLLGLAAEKRDLPRTAHCLVP